MSYPISDIDFNRLDITGKITYISKKSKSPLKFIYIFTTTKLYKICIPINSVFLDTLPSLIHSIVNASVLEVSTKGTKRYSLINIT